MTNQEKYQFFQKQFKKPWLTQGLNAVPLYLVTAAESGHTMKKYLGFDYSSFLFYFKNNYAEGSYAGGDFEKLWPKIKTRVLKDPGSILKLKKRYDQVFNRHLPWMAKIREEKLNGLSEAQLIKEVRSAGQCLIDSINLGHVIEIISFGLEKELTKTLAVKIPPEDFNKIFVELTYSTNSSFINEEEIELRKIKSKQALVSHSRKYYWLRTNYTGSLPADQAYFLKRIKKLTSLPKTLQKIKRSAMTIKLLKSPEIRQLSKFIQQLSLWQDRRKINIFKAIYHVEIVADELSRRTGIGVKELQYLSAYEFIRLAGLKEIIKLQKVLAERRGGVFYWIDVQGKREILASGSLFEKLEKNYHSLRSWNASVPLNIQGTIANPGKALGRVVICRSLKDISKVKQGDVLVISMTRPEFITAIKKASAIVTDEGGITCHAAIVSRELGIPCIIGVKIATKVLKDGDHVEVNANHGMVKILK